MKTGMDKILSISNLNVSFVSKRNMKDSDYFLKDLTFSIPQGKITALVGGNGAGKSTLFNIIGGLQKGAEGSIIFNGEQILGKSAHSIARTGIGRLFQGAKVFEELSVLDNMIIGAIQSVNEKPFYSLIFRKQAAKREKELKEKAVVILTELFGEDNEFLKKLYEKAADLSYGQKRLLALARLLMGEYSLYLLDEPTSGINVQFITQIASTIQKMKSINHKTILLIEHNMQFVRKESEYCLFMSAGKIIEEGLPDEVLYSETVQKAYMGF